MRSKGGISGMKQGAKHTMTGAYAGMLGESVMGAASRFKQGFMANRAARQAGG